MGCGSKLMARFADTVSGRNVLDCFCGMGPGTYLHAVSYAPSHGPTRQHDVISGLIFAFGGQIG